MDGKETTYYTRKNLLLAFIIGVIVGFGGFYLWSEKDAIRIIPQKNNTGETKGAMEIETKDESGAMNPREDYQLVVSNQPAAMEVHVDSVNTQENVWLAVYESGENGEPSNILGAYRFAAGAHEGATIPLLRNTEEGGTYYVMFHADDGDKEFDYDGSDSAITDVAGRPIMEQFTAIHIR